MVYIVPVFLFFLGYFITGAFHQPEAVSIAVGGVGFVLGILSAKLLDRWWKAHDPIQFKIVSIED